MVTSFHGSVAMAMQMALRQGASQAVAPPKAAEPNKARRLHSRFSFWAQGPSAVQQWRDAETGTDLRFQATLLEPLQEVPAADRRTDGKYPLMIYFSGVGSCAGLAEMQTLALRPLIKAPFVLVTPLKNKGMAWWFLDREGDWGWIEGELDAARVRQFSRWIRSLTEDASIDANHVFLLGYSAGSYAATEIFAGGEVRFRGLVLGGLHGHGQPDDENLDDKRLRWRDRIRAKWAAYISRLITHSGAPGGIFGVHNRQDDICPWSHANMIYQTLSQRQVELGFSPAIVKELDLEKKRKKKSVHNYFDQTFLRADLWEQLLAPPPQPPTEETAAATPEIAHLHDRQTSPPAQGGLAAAAAPSLALPPFFGEALPAAVDKMPVLAQTPCPATDIARPLAGLPEAWLASMLQYSAPPASVGKEAAPSTASGKPESDLQRLGFSPAAGKASEASLLSVRSESAATIAPRPGQDATSRDHAAAFAGAWNVGQISADGATLTWRGGSQVPITISGDMISMAVGGKSCAGVLNRDRIMWEDGVIWQREEGDHNGAGSQRCATANAAPLLANAVTSRALGQRQTIDPLSRGVEIALAEIIAFRSGPAAACCLATASRAYRAAMGSVPGILRNACTEVDQVRRHGERSRSYIRARRSDGRQWRSRSVKLRSRSRSRRSRKGSRGGTRKRERSRHA